MCANEQRTSKRFNYEAPVTIEDCDRGQYCSGRMYNYSLGGMYFETDWPLKPGSQIRVAIKKSRQGPAFNHFQAIVRWCEEIPDAMVLYNYGIGVQYEFAPRQAAAKNKLKVIRGGMRQEEI